jgi:hypothetical protein
VTFHEATLEKLPDLLAFRTQAVVDAFERNLRSGQLGVIAYLEGTAVAHAWMIINRRETAVVVNRYFRLKPREALIHFCNVAEPHRGKGLFQAILFDLYRRTFAEQPVDRIYIDTEIANLASRKAIQRTATFLRNEYYLSFFSRMLKLPWSG